MTPPVTHASLHELTTALQAATQTSTECDSQQLCVVHLTLAGSALVPLERPKVGPYSEGRVQDLPSEFKRGPYVSAKGDEQDQGIRSAEGAPHTTVESICGVQNADQLLVVQRAAARGIKDAIEAADGYRYILKNSWCAAPSNGELMGHRFSYICLDSMQNQNRCVNGSRKTTKRVRAYGRLDARKPTYDCKGNILIKINCKFGNVEVVYKHIPLHLTVAQGKGKAQSDTPPSSSVGFSEKGFTGSLRAELQSWSACTVPQSDSMSSTPEAHAPLANTGVKRTRDAVDSVRDIEPKEANAVVEHRSHRDSRKEAVAPTYPRRAVEASQHGAPVFYDVSTEHRTSSAVLQPAQKIQKSSKQRPAYQSPHAEP